MTAYLLDVSTFLLRWLHVVAAIAWIGESFYFVALDRGLKRKDGAPANELGESWSVHGGGFYLKRKFLVAPDGVPEDLHWSKWKSYTTWLSGFALFTLTYLAAPAIQLVDPAVRPLDATQAVALAVAFPVVAWVAYDVLCRIIGFRDGVLGIAVALLVLAIDWWATQLFAGRAAFLLVGAALGTIMSANVFFVIIPGQKRMVAALARGEQVDPLPGLRGKQRSVHNTYFTLPVVFAMLSNHYAPAFAHEQRWAILALFMLAGALIRQFFVLWHSGGRAWWLLAAGAATLGIAFAWLAPRATDGGASNAAAVTTAQVRDIAAKHCIQCHSAQPTLMPSAPKGTMFDTEAQLDQHALAIHQQVVVLKIMPPG
ncbi:MAG TPA: urate hydroxylase PuuD, partial [Xanthomonadales bacterium]|nr:urate hydroxylase PuuD [Xanthomonadales bacterium]